MRIVVLCAMLLAAVVPSGAGAQSLALTEAEALARLSPQSPRVRVIRAAIDLARSDVAAAGRWPNPRVTFDRESVAGVTEGITTMAQTLPVTGRRGLEVEARSALVDAASNRADDAWRRAQADLRLAFAQLVAAQAREQELAAAGDRLHGLAGVLAKREAAGDASGFDRLRAEREAVDADADLAIAASDRARLQALVASFFAEPAGASRILAIAAVGARAPLPSAETLLERSESVRGDLLALRKEIDAARLSRRAAERRRVPEPEIVAGIKSSTSGGGDVGSVLMVQAVLPLFDRGRPERQLADAKTSLAEHQLAASRLSVRTEVTALRAQVLERRETAQRYNQLAVNASDQIERIAQVSYDAGERGILELLDAYRTGTAARLRLALLELSVRQAEIELEFVSGWEIPS